MTPAVRAIPDCMRTLMAGIADTVFVLGNDFRPVWCSNADGRLLGRDLDSWQPGTLGESIHPGDQVWLQRKRHEILSSPEAAASGYVRLREGDGSYSTVLLTATNEFDDPEINGIVVTLAPVADQAADSSAGQHDRRSQETSRQDDLLSQLSVEIRSGLATIAESATAISLDANLDSIGLTNTATIDSATRTLEALLDDAEDLSKISSGTMQLDSIVFSPSELVDDVAATFAPLCAQNGLDLELCIDAALPQRVFGDPARLSYVLHHLISTAVRTGADGSLRIEANLNADAKIQFRVSDTGAGIRNGFFDPLSTDPRSGSGIGLALAMQIVELMDGSLGQETNEQGTTLWFDVELGLARRIEDLPTTPPSTAREVSTSAHILVVDDSDVNRLLATSQLERLGHTFSTAQSGQEALEQLTSSAFDAVLMDWHMPGIDGLEATRRWRAEHDPDHNLPIITMTASAMAGDRERCLEAGASDYLSKPVSITDLGSVLTRWTQPSPSSHAPSTTSTAPAIEAPLLYDQSRVSALIADLGDITVVHSIVEAFRQMVPQYRASAQNALTEGDRNTIRRSAHTLKSTALMLGTSDLAAACITLEAAATNDIADLEAPLAEFGRCCDRAELSLAELATDLVVAENQEQ